MKNAIRDDRMNDYKMPEVKTLILEMIVNIETEKYRNVNELIRLIKDDFYIEQLICGDKDIEIDTFQIQKIDFYDKL